MEMTNMRQGPQPSTTSTNTSMKHPSKDIKPIFSKDRIQEELKRREQKLDKLRLEKELKAKQAEELEWKKQCEERSKYMKKTITGPLKTDDFNKKISDQIEAKKRKQE